MPSFNLIGSTTVGAGGSATISFTGIPSTYTDLYLKLSARTGTAVHAENANITLNSNSSAIYGARRFFGSSFTLVSSDSFSAFTYMPGVWVTGASASSNTFSNINIYIGNYAGSNNKQICVDSVTETNNSSTSGPNQGLTAGTFGSSTAISSISISSGSNFVQYSTAYLYGISNA